MEIQEIDQGTDFNWKGVNELVWILDEYSEGEELNTLEVSSLANRASETATELTEDEIEEACGLCVCGSTASLQWLMEAGAEADEALEEAGRVIDEAVASGEWIVEGEGDNRRYRHRDWKPQPATN